MLALEQYEQGLCKRCGHCLEESTSREHDFNNPFGAAYYARAEGTPIQCHACAALERSEKQAVEQEKAQHPGAQMHVVELRPRG